MTGIRRTVVTDLGEIVAHISAIQDAVPDGLLQVVASSPERTTGSAVCVDGDRFTVRTVLLNPEPECPEIGVTEGDVADLADEVASIVHHTVDDSMLLDAPTPVAPGPELLAEDAVLLAETVLEGDPDKERQVLDLLELPATPRWLRDLAFGARLRLTVCLLDIWEVEQLAEVVVTDDGWGRLDLHGERLRFTPLTTRDVQRQLRGACARFVQRHGHAEVTC